MKHEDGVQRRMQHGMVSFSRCAVFDRASRKRSHSTLYICTLYIYIYIYNDYKFM